MDGDSTTNRLSYEPPNGRYEVEIFKSERIGDSLDVFATISSGRYKGLTIIADCYIGTMPTGKQERAYRSWLVAANQRTPMDSSELHGQFVVRLRRPEIGGEHYQLQLVEPEFRK